MPTENFYIVTMRVPLDINMHVGALGIPGLGDVREGDLIFIRVCRPLP
jgi:hypothetical protein